MNLAISPDARAWIEVDLQALQANLVALRTPAGAHAAVLAVVKADAYGHGMLPAAHAALDAGAHWLGVAAVSEGVALREAGIAAPILLICHPAPGEAAALIAHHLTPMIGDPVLLRAVAAAAGPGYEIHLEIDTGIGRAGILPEQALSFWRQAETLRLRVTGISTHFSSADDPNATLNCTQEAVFNAVRAELEHAGAHFRWVHLSNSAALWNGHGAGANLVRPGLMLYGVHPGGVEGQEAGDQGSVGALLASPETLPRDGEDRNLAPSTSRRLQESLQGVRRQESGCGPIRLTPVLSLKARVATVRDLPVGHPISYGATYHLTRPSRLATVLIGYGDGYPRRLSNRGQVLLNGRYAPILGRVCMDQIVVDVTEIEGVAPGDTAVCIGAQGGERITVEQVASLIDATPHEITTSLSPRLPRVYI